MTRPLQLPPDCVLVAFESIDSTNDHAKILARAGHPSGTLIWAKTQTAGRGRRGNAWSSLEGNLFMSLILKPGAPAALIGQLSFLASVALARTLKPLLPEATRVDLKWPNDLLINGRKAAGILLETESNGSQPVDWLVAGIGVNIETAPEGATCLKAEGAAPATAADVLETLITHLMSLYMEWKEKGFASVRAEWLDSACNLGKNIQVRLPRETLSGIFLGIDGAGALLLETADGQKKTIASGEVFAA